MAFVLQKDMFICKNVLVEFNGSNGNFCLSQRLFLQKSMANMVKNHGIGPVLFHVGLRVSSGTPLLVFIFRYILLPGMSVVGVAVTVDTVSPITTISLFVGPQASIDPSLPALGPPGHTMAATQGRHNKDLGFNMCPHFKRSLLQTDQVREHFNISQTTQRIQHKISNIYPISALVTYSIQCRNYLHFIIPGLYHKKMPLFE